MKSVLCVNIIWFDNGSLSTSNGGLRELPRIYIYFKLKIYKEYRTNNVEGTTLD